MNLDTDVCNEALLMLNQGIEISDIVNDRSQSARTMRRFYPIAVRFVTRACPWPKHKKIGALSEVTNPSAKWGKAYRYPGDCENFLAIDNGQVIQTPQNQIAFEEARDSVGRIILTNESEASGEWMIVVEDPNQWDADFRLCVIHYLAHLSAPALTAGDPNKLGITNLQLFEKKLSAAAAKALNECQKPYDTSSGYSRARR